MGLAINALDIPETPQGISDLENLSFTKFPNIWLDEIRYELDKTVCDIVECVFRHTLGYHKPTAEITTQEFANYARVSLTTMKKAKKEAIACGILVLLRQGGGLTTSEYKINLNYNQDDLGTLPVALVKEERIPEPPAKEEAKILHPPISKPQPPQEPELPKNPKPQKTERTKKQAKSTGTENARPHSRSKKDQDLDKKTNKNVTRDLENPEEKKKLENVCFLLRKLGFEITDKALAFLKRMAAKFGVEKILEKIRIMRSQIARNIVIKSFQAWLFSAVKHDYQPYVADAKKIEADAAREREIERTHLEFQKREIERQKLIEAENNNPDGKKELNELFARYNLPQFSDRGV